jgi:2-methylcitrate dehydratase PrpD
VAALQPGLEPTAQLTGLYADLKYSGLSAAARHAAKRVLLDATGVMLAASGMGREVDGFVALARDMGEGPCRIAGTGHKVSPVMAALANGAMAHALDYEDAFDLAPGHPNASLVPALLALAQSRGPVDGPRFITSLVAGCDLACRMGLALRQKMELGGWYPPPILAGHGATLGAAHLLGLDARQMADALSLALCQVTMPGEIKHSERTVIRAIREAFPAQAAVQAALLAERGLAGFEQPLEGKAGFFALYAGGKFEAAVLLAPFAGRFWIEQLTFKPWPSCRGTHPFIEMALATKVQHGFDAGQVESIVVGVGPMQRMLVEPLARKRAPEVAIDAKFSVPFCTASAMVNGAVGLDSFGPEELRDPAVLALAGKIEFEQPPEAELWRGDAGTLTIILKDGRRFDAALDRARGTADNPLSDVQMIGKFVDCAARAARPLTSGEADELAGRILSLEECSDVGALFQR